MASSSKKDVAVSFLEMASSGKVRKDGWFGLWDAPLFPF